MKNELVKLLVKLITKNKNKSPISVRGLVIRILEIRFDNETILGSAMIQKTVHILYGNLRLPLCFLDKKFPYIPAFPFIKSCINYLIWIKPATPPLHLLVTVVKLKSESLSTLR